MNVNTSLNTREKDKKELIEELQKASNERNFNEAKRILAELEKIQGKNNLPEKTADDITKETQKHEKEKLTLDTPQTEKSMKIEELKKLLQDSPENIDKNSETIIEQAKERLKKTIERYINKIKEIKDANGEEIKKLKEELKNEKNIYEKVKKDFFAKSTYTFDNFTADDLKKIPTNIVRYATRENKLFNTPQLSKMKTIRRNRTLKTLIKKFNKIGNKSIEGTRFIMGFEKSRFLRYSGIKLSSAIDKIGSSIGMQMNPQDFHTKFNAGRKNIFAILDMETGENKTEGEKTVIKAIKDRINNYGAIYARERANARVAPFIEAEKNAGKESRIIQMKTDKNAEKNAGEESRIIQMNTDIAA